MAAYLKVMIGAVMVIAGVIVFVNSPYLLIDYTIVFMGLWLLFTFWSCVWNCRSTRRPKDQRGFVGTTGECLSHNCTIVLYQGCTVLWSAFLLAVMGMTVEFSRQIAVPVRNDLLIGIGYSPIAAIGE